MTEEPREEESGASEDAEAEATPPSEVLESFAEAEATPEPAESVAAPTDSGGAGPKADSPEGESPQAASPDEADTPYSGLLRIKGDVGQTQAIALFLGGLSAFLFAWWFLTWGNPQNFEQTSVVADDGTIALTQLPAPGVEIWAEGYSFAPDAETLTDRQFKLSGTALQFDASLKGEEVVFGYRIGREPIVSHYVLPQPTKVLAAVIYNLTGPSFQLMCPNAECGSRKAEGGMVELSSGDGADLQAFRGTRGETPAPTGVTCPTCKASLDGEVVNPLPPYRYRSGLLSTIQRTLVGFGIAAVICIPLGVLAGAFPPIKRFVSPLEIAGGYTPPVALLPLAVALYGVAKNSGMDSMTSAELARISFLVVVIAFWLYPLVTMEVEAVDEVYVNTAYTLGASRTQVILKVLVPVTLASIWGHLRATYAIGWASIILAEGYAVGREAGETGIGFFMVDMQRRNIMENYFAALLAIIAAGIVIDYVFKIVGRWLFPYEEAK